MGLDFEFLERRDSRWDGILVLEAKTCKRMNSPLLVGIFRDGRLACLVLIHDAPEIESWRDALCLQDVVLIAGNECVHRISMHGTPEMLPSLPVSGYFVAFYAPSDMDALEESFVALVSGCECVMRIDSCGEIMWTSDRLGIDGVVLHRINEGSIEGAGEWDPPGGWELFQIDLATGRILVESSSRKRMQGLPNSCGSG